MLDLTTLAVFVCWLFAAGSYFAMRIRLEQLRRGARRGTDLPSSLSLFTDWGFLSYVWSDRAWSVKDRLLERFVIMVRLSFVLFVGAAVALVAGR